MDSGGRVHEFFYNALSELLAETHPDFGAITYTLDPNGNRTSWTRAGVTTWAAYDRENRLLWTNQAGNFAPTSNQPQPYRIYTYNANGEPTGLEHRDAGQDVLRDRYDWDGMGKLRRILCVGSTQERYTAEYDGFGTRVRSTWNGLASTYSFGAGLLHTDRSAGGNVTYTPGVGQRLGSADAFFHTDWLGSTRYLTAGDGRTVSSAYRYDSFGNLTAFAGTDGTVLKWAGAWGYQADVPMGLLQVGERLFDPEIGRWLSPDPIGFAAGLNLYAYCDGNPVNNADPSGLDPLDPETATDDEITHFGRLVTRQLVAAPFHSEAMAYANRLHERIGYGRFRFGNRPVGQDLLTVHAIFGSIGAGGPVLRGAGAFRGGSSLGCGGRGPSWWQRLVRRIGGLFDRGPIVGDKLEYIFGRASGSPHNVARSRQMLRQLQSIGIHDTPEGRAFLVDHLRQLLRDRSTIAHVQPDGRVVRESLLMGPHGGLKMVSIWERNRLITVLLYGGRF